MDVGQLPASINSEAFFEHAGSGELLSNSPSKRDIQVKLEAGQQALRRTRWSVSGVLFLFGVVLVLEQFLAADSWLDNGWLVGDMARSGNGSSKCKGKPEKTFMSSTCQVVLAYRIVRPAGVLLLNFAPLEDDVLLTRVAACITLVKMALSMSVWYLEKCTFQANWSERVEFTIFIAAQLVRGTVVVAGLAYAIALHEPSRMQQVVRVSLLIWHGTYALSLVIVEVLTVIGIANLHIHCVFARILTGFIFTLCYSTQSLRNRMQGVLAGLLDRRRERMAAAGVGSLIGECSPELVLRLAIPRFRVVFGDRLPREAFAHGIPSAEMRRLSVPARLGECDAFISHSWKDDSEAKWAALQEWRKSFKSTHGREPSFWMDKVCIDEANAEIDLACLPVFISGCTQTLALCGKTFFNRLWCIIELCVHYHVGRSRLVLLPVLPGNYPSTDFLSLALALFDVEHCTCYSSRDRDLLIRVIKVSCGSTAAFNQAFREDLIKHVLVDVSDTRLTSSSSDETSDSDTMSTY